MNAHCEKHEWSASHTSGPCPDCAELAKLMAQIHVQKITISRLSDGLEIAREEIASLKESLREVLDISEVEGAVNLTTMESAKLMGARTLLGPDSRFART